MERNVVLSPCHRLLRVSSVDRMSLSGLSPVHVTHWADAFPGPGPSSTSSAFPPRLLQLVFACIQTQSKKLNSLQTCKIRGQITAFSSILLCSIGFSLRYRTSCSNTIQLCLKAPPPPPKSHFLIPSIPFSRAVMLNLNSEAFQVAATTIKCVVQLIDKPKIANNDPLFFGENL